MEAVRAVSARHAKSLEYGRVLKLAEGQVLLGFPSEAAFHRATITGSARPMIEKALSEHFGAPTRITAEQLPAGGTPPGAELSLGEQAERRRAEREREVDARARSHPALLETLRVLGGKLEHLKVLEASEASSSAPSPRPPEE